MSDELPSASNECLKIINDLKSKIPTIDINCRAQALAIYNLLAKYQVSDKKSDDDCDINDDIYSSEKKIVCEKNSQIIQGLKKVQLQNFYLPIDDFSLRKFFIFFMVFYKYMHFIEPKHCFSLRDAVP